MSRILLVGPVLLLLTGCSFLLPQPGANEPPEAHITSISPTDVMEEEVVAFSGYGTDGDGEVVAYRWRSSIDGQLSTQPSFQSSSLSVGYHIIYFAVRDDSGEWSDEVDDTLRVRSVETAPTTQPTIRSFSADASTIVPRDAITLSWEVTGADAVTIDQGIGTVSALGSLETSIAQTTTYELTATGNGTTVKDTVTIVVDPPAQKLSITPDIEMSGFIRSSGSVTPGEIWVGDDDANRGVRGFLTYDISRIPKDAVITQVTLELSGYETPYGLPFEHLGCLSAFEHRYNTLHGEYLMPGIEGQIGEWCGFADLDSATNLPGFQDRLQDRLHTGTFQFRLQFAEMESDGDGTRDMLRWPRQQMPVMSVEYYIPK